MLRMLAFAALLSAPASAAELTIDEGMPWQVARQAVVDGGWNPVTEHEDDIDARCGGSRNDVCEAYPETEACSGTGSGFCAFAYQADGRRLTVTTRGESMVVDGWRVE